MSQAIVFAPTPSSPSLSRRRAGRAVVRALRRSGPALGIAVILAIFFHPLLIDPATLPITPGDGTEAQGHLDTLQQSRHFETTGDLLHLSWAGLGRNLAATPGALFTHPVFFALRHVARLPAGLSITLTILAYVFAGALATFGIARRAQLGWWPALYAAAAFALTGKLLASGTVDSTELGALLVAALFPALVWAGLRCLERPTVENGTVLGVVIAAASWGGDIPALALALLLAALVLPALWFLLDRRDLTRESAGVLLLALAWGLALGASRWLPVALGGELTVAGLLDAPWWSGASSIRLPYHLGAVTLIAFCLGARNLLGRPAARPLLVLAAAGVALGVAGPPVGLPFLGFFFGVTSAAAFAVGGTARRPWLRQGLAAVAIVVLIVECRPFYREHLQATKADAIVQVPRWAETLARYPRGGRVAVLGADSRKSTAALAALELPVFDGAGSWKDINKIEAGDAVALAVSNVRYLVSDLPDARRRFRLLRFHREEGKYLYRNPAWFGPASWTRRIETHSSQRIDGSRGDLLVPSGLRAVVLPRVPAGFENDFESAGEARAGWSVITDWERSASRFRCRVAPDGDAVLVLAEPRLAGMSASVDGETTTILPANGRDIGVLVPRGAHEVQIDFRPPGLDVGATLSSLALTLLPFLLILPRLNRRVRRSARLQAPSQRLRSRRRPELSAVSYQRSASEDDEPTGVDRRAPRSAAQTSASPTADS